jgi:predicted fused transcriptional regulator/phosphomethylpyrimidine kinase/predicted transcriptional regulator
MHPPCTIVVDIFLPSLRGLVAHELRRGGRMSQGRMAAMLGITQPAISQILSKGPGTYRRKLKGLGLDDQEVDRSVSILCEDMLRSPVEGVQTFLAICRDMLARGFFCDEHRRRAPFLSKCDACMKIMASPRMDDARRAVLDQLERAAEAICASPFITAIMPEVSVNLVMAAKDTAGEADVAGFPGRIVRLNDRAHAIAPPRFGASHHMAQMLLTAMRFDPGIRSAMNVKYDPKVEAAMTRMGLKIGRTMRTGDAVGGNDPIVDSLAKLGGLKGSIPSVVVDEGSRGLEPMTYLFGSDAISVAERAMALSRQYAGLH